MKKKKLLFVMLISVPQMYLKHNSLGEDIPIVVILKAMGLESDQEIVQLVGSEPEICDLFSGSLEEPYMIGIMSQQQVSSPL
jgi:DNA-directed RNA polymerase III subunit RPC2